MDSTRWSLRTIAFSAMSRTATRISNARCSAIGTSVGSAERVALADLRTQMDDLRIAFSAAIDQGYFSEIDRNGYAPLGRN